VPFEVDAGVTDGGDPDDRLFSLENNVPNVGVAIFLY
jgi:hypothetical protein